LDAVGDRRVLLAVWFVVLPAVLFGTLAVLGPLRLSHLGFSSVAIGATWLVAGMLETANSLAVGRLADRFGAALRRSAWRSSERSSRQRFSHGPETASSSRP